MNALIYDIEIKKAVPGRDRREEGVEYCAGWHDHANMGISVIGVYDYANDRYRVFCDDNKAAFVSLVKERELCIGFNSIPFDNSVINVTQDWGTMVEEKCYDLLREMWLAAGLPAAFTPEKNAGYGLDATCEKNFGLKKTGNGAYAPALWQRGRIGDVIDYCLNDVMLTKRMFDYVRVGAPIKDPKTGALLTLRRP